ncbi:MAG: DUF3142 domain-containing protein [Rhodospirillales bacterium]|nr:DUF3142 domain-containing protein [Rhodospirillales bacterium]
MPARWFIWLLVSAILSGPARAADTPQGDAYVWQRRWTPAVATAVGAATDLVHAWRVLVAQSDARGRLHAVEPDWPVLAATGRPLVAVIRLDGQSAGWDPVALRAAVLVRLQAVPVPLAGIEIDHDCATAALPAYAGFLADLRPVLPAGLTLSITALPTWIGSPALTDVLRRADEAVLQVHAVQSPEAGLFEPVRARQWIDAFAAVTPHPFRVSLPTYGVRVAWGPNGRLRAVESERPLLAGGDGTDLVAAPRDVAALVADLAARPPHRFAGLAWFRLPVATDHRAWTLATWRAVIGGGPLAADAQVMTEPADDAALRLIVLANPGAVDVVRPRLVTLPHGCGAADGAGAYALVEAPEGPALRRRQAGLLRPHARELIGWMRCDAAVAGVPEVPHVGG